MEIPNKKMVAIVTFNNMPQVRPIYYQITIDPKDISDGGEFIRLGNAPGDEITGWQRIDSLDIQEKLAEVGEDGELDPPPRVS